MAKVAAARAAVEVAAAARAEGTAAARAAVVTAAAGMAGVKGPEGEATVAACCKSTSRTCGGCLLTPRCSHSQVFDQHCPLQGKSRRWHHPRQGHTCWRCLRL